MKCIVLAKMGKRIFAAIIDLLITLAISIGIFFAAILPACIDQDAFLDNQNGMNSLKDVSGLYVKIEQNNVVAYDLKIDVISSKLTSNLDVNAINYLNSYTLNDKTVSVIDSLVRFYSEPAKRDDKYLFVSNAYEISTIEKNLLKAGTETSNIKSLTLNPETGLYEIAIIDEKQRNVTFDFIAGLIKPDSFEDTISASELVIKCSYYSEYENANKNMMLFALLMIIPVLFGVSLIFYLIIPLCAKNGETIGKFMLGLGVLSTSGYVLKKYFHIPRYFALFICELAGGILSFGGLFLVSYLMFCFTKKRKSLHDFVGNSVVIDKKESTWFVDRDQEYKYNYKTRIN